MEFAPGLPSNLTKMVKKKEIVMAKVGGSQQKVENEMEVMEEVELG